MWKRVMAPLQPLGAPPVRRVAAVLIAVLVGGWLGLLLGGNVSVPIGPVQAQLSIRPWPTGDTVVHIAPLGDVTFDTHDGPLRVQASVERIRPQAARRIVQHPQSLTGLGNRVVDDLRGAVIRLVVKATVSAVAGAALFALVVYRRRWWLVGGSAGAALAVVIASGIVGYATFNPKSIEEPRYTGLLASAPRVVGSVEHLTKNFSQYRKELARLVTNVSQIYGVTSKLTVYEPKRDTIRVMHVSDLHLNPAAWNVMHSVAQQFKVNVIIDTGDLVDNGTSVENKFVRAISSFDVPYVYVRGNHDSRSTQKAVASEPNAVVLNGTVKEAAGLRIFGAGDPRFTPGKLTHNAKRKDQVEQAAGLQLAERLRAANKPADIVAFHEPVEARTLDGYAPLLLAGHMHSRSTEVLSHGSRLMVEGSTGGAGMRALDGKYPTPIELSVLYLDKQTHRLQAWDSIKVGGLGLSTAQITRHTVDKPDREITPPGESPSPGPSGGSGSTAPPNNPGARGTPEEGSASRVGVRPSGALS